MRLPSGKMSSRTGQNILYSDMKVEFMEKLVEEVEKRHKEWDEKRKMKSVTNILSAAAKWDMLVQDVNSVIVFNMQKAMDLEGDTGPYVQYAHARCCSILKKFGKDVTEKVNFDLLQDESTIALLKTLQEFPEVVEHAAEQYVPALVARYVLKLAKQLNSFYVSNKVISEDEELTKARILLVYCVKEVIAKALGLLAIRVSEEM